MAAPIASQVLGEVLPYLEAVKDNEKEEDIKQEVEVPNVIGLTVKEAEKKLKELGLEIQINSEEEINKEQSIIKEQLPIEGIKVYEGTKVIGSCQ